MMVMCAWSCQLLGHFPVNIIPFLPSWVVLEVRALCLHHWMKRLKLYIFLEPGKLQVTGSGTIKENKRERKLSSLRLPRSKMDMEIEMFLLEKF